MHAYPGLADRLRCNDIRLSCRNSDFPSSAGALPRLGETESCDKEDESRYKEEMTRYMATETCYMSRHLRYMEA